MDPGRPTAVRAYGPTLGGFSQAHDQTAGVFGRASNTLDPGNYSGASAGPWRDYTTTMGNRHAAVASAYDKVASALPRVAASIEEEEEAQRADDLAKRRVTHAQTALRNAQKALSDAELAQANWLPHGHATTPPPVPAALYTAVSQATHQLAQAVQAETKADHQLQKAKQHLQQVCRAFAAVCKEAEAVAHLSIPVPPDPLTLLAFGYAESGGFLSGSYNPFAPGNVIANSPLWAQMVNTMCWKGGTYTGGGFITGPDGVRYPLVVPMVPDGHGGFYNASADGSDLASSLDGSDPGWYTVHTYIGTGQLFGGSSPLALFAAGVVAGWAPTVRAASPNDYQNLDIDGDGLPVWTGRNGSTNYNDSSDAPDQPVEPSSFAANAAAGGVGQIISMVNSGANATQVNNVGYGAYKVMFQRNLDGRTRAAISTYRVAYGDDGTPVIVPQSVSYDGQGHPQTNILRYQPPAVQQPTANAGSGAYHVLDHFGSPGFPWNVLGDDTPEPRYYHGS